MEHLRKTTKNMFLYVSVFSRNPHPRPPFMHLSPSRHHSTPSFYPIFLYLFTDNILPPDGLLMSFSSKFTKITKQHFIVFTSTVCFLKFQCIFTERGRLTAHLFLMIASLILRFRSVSITRPHNISNSSK